MTVNKNEHSRGATVDDFIDEVINTPGFGECLRLCDVSTMESVCEKIPEAFAASAVGQGESYGLHVGLLQELHGPVSRFAEELERWQAEKTDIRRRRLERLASTPVRVGVVMRQEMGPTLEFLECIEHACGWIQHGPWGDDQAAACAAYLQAGWCKWIAYLSSVVMWSKVPRWLAQKKLAKRNGNQPARDGKPGKPAEFDQAAIYRKYCDLRPSKGRYAAGIVAEQFGCTPTHVRNIARRMDGEKSETNPDG